MKDGADFTILMALGLVVVGKHALAVPALAHVQSLSDDKLQIDLIGGHSIILDQEESAEFFAKLKMGIAAAQQQAANLAAQQLGIVAPGINQKLH